MKIENVAIDRINLRIEKVKFKEFEQLEMSLKHQQKGGKLKAFSDYQDTEDDLFHMRKLEKLGGADYRYNLYLDDGSSGGAVYIAYRHNSAKPSEQYDLKIEFNPSKSNKAQESLFKVMARTLKLKIVRLVEFDVAMDLQHKASDIYVINKSGKLPSSYDTTRYFGQKHTNGYLKLYDKLKEQKLSVSPQGSPHLTRVEFTLRPKDNTGMICQELKQYRFDLDKSYDIGSLDVIDDITVKCMAISLTYGHIKRAELPRRQKDLITKELARVGNKLRIDKLLNKHWDDLLKGISQWFGESKDYTKNYAIFGTEQRELTEEEQLLFESLLDFNNKKEHKKSLTESANLS